MIFLLSCLLLWLASHNLQPFFEHLLMNCPNKGWLTVQYLVNNWSMADSKEVHKDNVSLLLLSSLIAETFWKNTLILISHHITLVYFMCFRTNILSYVKLKHGGSGLQDLYLHSVLWDMSASVIKYYKQFTFGQPVLIQSQSCRANFFKITYHLNIIIIDIFIVQIPYLINSIPCFNIHLKSLSFTNYTFLEFTII